MPLMIERVAVLGAGVMGRQLAAVLANAGLQVDLLDIVPSDAGERRSVLAERARQELRKMSPPPLVHDRVVDRIRPGNFEDHWDRVLNADWVLEAVIERLDVKRMLLERLDVPGLRARWVTTNTSGLSIRAMIEGRTPRLAQRFLGTHFFNPPRYLLLVEVVPHDALDISTAHDFAGWVRQRLGKRVVWAKDTPNFIANRLAVFQTLTTLRLMDRYQLSVEEVDTLTGPLLGRPRTATFRTLDLVGLDIFAATVRTLQERATSDEFHDWFVLPEWLQGLIEAGALGRKVGKGIYWRRQDERLVYDPQQGDYRPLQRPQYPWFERARRLPTVPERVRLIQRQAEHLGEFMMRLLAYGSLYAVRRIPEIADAFPHIDRAIRWGFQWEWGPFQIWDQFGLDPFLQMADELPAAPAPLLEAMAAQKATSFYQEQPKPRYFDLHARDYRDLDDPPPWSPVQWLTRTQQPVRANAGASLYEIGDGIGLLLLHPQNNAIGLDVLEMVQRALEFVAENGQGLILTGRGDHFSYGAHLGLLVMALQNRDVAQLDWTVRTFQHITQSLRRAPFPVVVAPHGMALGGGCEFTMHADRVVAPVETYMGLVELGAGLIPAGGGCAEILRRVNARVDMTQRVKPWVHYLDRLAEFFRHVAQAQVSRSAVEAREWGYLRDTDVIIPDADERIRVAKEVIQEMVPHYRPPDAEQDRVWVLGQDGLAYLRMMIHMMHRGGFITDYDRVLADHLAQVLSGGDVPHPVEVPISYVLDLEREHFLALCRERKSYERIAHIIAYGKPLRN